MTPAHLAEYTNPVRPIVGPHPRLKVIELLNYIRYLAEPRAGALTNDAWEGEMSRIHKSALCAIRELGSEPGPDGSALCSR